MKVTIAICTWNRAKLLDQTLAQMHQLRVPSTVEWELLVVNNNCTDGTDEIISRHEGALPIRRLFEPALGHSNARNCAIGASSGELIVWTDDDVLVDPDWLAAYYAAATSWPEAAFFGGPVDPWFESAPPLWVVQNEKLVNGPFAVCQHGDAIRPFEKGESPVGANMAFRTSVLKRFPFNPALGRLGKKLTGCDETDALCRIKQAGFYGVSVGTAKVRHWVPKTRMTYRYVWDWHVGAGVTEIRRTGLPDGVYWSGVPRWATRLYIAHRLRSWWYRACGDRRWADEFQHAAETWGQILESRELWQRARGPQPSLPAALS